MLVLILSNMAHNTLFIFLIFLFHLFPLLILSESTCPSPTSFDCPGIGPMEFPFSNSDTPTDCGLFTVNCTNSSHTLLQLESGGTWYQILHKISPNKLSIRDTGLQNLLHRNSCRSLFNQSLPTHTTPFTSFAISPTFTVFTCFNVSNLNETNQNFQSHNCWYYMAYYRNPANTSVYNQNVIPRPCLATELPVNSGQYMDNLFELISSNFTLHWNVSEECMSCHARGGQCSTNSMNEFFCRTAGITVTSTYYIALMLKHYLYDFDQIGIVKQSNIMSKLRVSDTLTR